MPRCRSSSARFRSDWRLVGRVVLLLVAVRLGLWLLPFQRLRRLLAARKPGRAVWSPAAPVPLTQITRAVAGASRYIPGATCLTQALAMQVLLRQQGYASRLRIGVHKGAAGTLQAHAWVECQGRVVIGDDAELSHYTPLPALQ